MPGTRIRELRLIAGMSQEELGRRVGVQRAAIQKYEKGTVENIPIHTIEKIAAVFEVSPSYILGWGIDSPNPLATEVKIIQGVNSFFGKEAVELLEDYVALDNQGKQKVLDYANDMVCIYSITDLNDV